MSSHSLLFDGSIELCDHDALGEIDGYWFTTLSQGASFGDPQPIEVGIDSLLRDGAVEQTTGHGNREQTWLVTINATDQHSLALGMGRLASAVGRRTTMVWTPPDGFGLPTVFDVETSSFASPDGVDDLEYMQNRMVVALRLRCQPFGRSVAGISTSAEALPSTVEVFNDCETIGDFEVPAWGSGVSVHPGDPPDDLTLDAAEYIEGAGSMKVGPWASYDIEGTFPFVGVIIGSRHLFDFKVNLTDVEVDGSGYFSFALRGFTGYQIPQSPSPVVGLRAVAMYSTERGAEWLVWGSHYPPPPAPWYPNSSTPYNDDGLPYVGVGPGSSYVPFGTPVVQAMSDGWTRYTFRITDATTIETLRFIGVIDSPVAVDDTNYPYVWIDEIALAESGTTARQLLRDFDVEGTQRTQGSIHIGSSSDAIPLGQVCVFTCSADDVPTGYRPDLRQWATAGDTTADAESTFGSAFNGTGTDYGVDAGASDAPVWEAPASLFNGGAHTIVARIKETGGTAVTFGVEATMFLGGDQVGVVETVEQYVPLEDIDGKYAHVVIGTLYLPTTPIVDPQTDAMIRFRFKTSNAVNLDDVYAFPIDGDFTIVDCGDGVVGAEASSHLWIDSPSPTAPRGGYWRGSANTRQSTLSAWTGVKAPGAHFFKPGRNLLFASCSNADGPTAEVDHYPRWWTHAAR